jgi:hypothetical protein
MAQHSGDGPNGTPKGAGRAPILDLAPDSAPPPAERFADGLGLPAASAAVGGVIGLALALVFAAVGLWPTPRGADPVQLAEARAAAGRAETAVGALAGRLDQTAAALAKVQTPAAPPAADPTRLDDLARRLGQQEQTLAALAARFDAARATVSQPAAAAAPMSTEARERLDAFAAEVAALGRSVAAAGALGDRITAAEKAAATVPDLTGRLDGLVGRLRDLDAVVAPLKTLPDGVAELAARSDKLEAALTDLRRLATTLEARAGDTTARVAGLASARQDAVLALALADLRTAVDAGRPFVEPLAVVGALRPDDAPLAALQPLAKTGVPPVARLAATFPALARRIGEAELAKRSAGGGVVDRLLAQARQSVTVRALDEPAGDSVPARLVRIETALGAGDVAAALTDWRALPEAARALDPTFGTALAARATLDAALAAATRSALDRLAGRTP